MCNGSIVHHSLGEFRCVLGDVAEGGGRDAFEGHLRLQKTQHQQGHSTGIHDRLRQGCTYKEVEERYEKHIQVQMQGESADNELHFKK